jgi:hypothetical protein
MNTGVLSRWKAAGTCRYSSTLIWRRCFGMLRVDPFLYLLLGYLRRTLCLLGIPLVESRNVGIALDEGVFDRMEIALTEILCVRGIQALSLK